MQKSTLEFKPPTALWQTNRVTMLHIGGRLDLPLLYTTHNCLYSLLEKAEIRNACSEMSPFLTKKKRMIKSLRTIGYIYS
jgi:hypothetical protein